MDYLIVMYKTICWGGILGFAVGASAVIPGPPATVVAWGDQSRALPVGLSGIVQVQAGWEHSLALTTNGTVIGWGVNNYGDLEIPSGLSNVVAVAAGSYHNLALTRKGTVVGWGWAGQDVGQIHPPPGLSNVVAIAAGFYHSLALRNDGTIMGWGQNADGQLNVPPGLTNAIAIGAGVSHSMALAPDGKVWAWGNNTYGQTNVPAYLSGVVGLAGGEFFGLAISRAPIILTQVVSRVVNAGTNLSLEVVASGIGHLTYQWQFNGSDIAGATNRTLDFINVQTNDSGSYAVIINNEQGQVASGATLLAMIPPMIVHPPETQTVLAGTNVTFSVVATGFPSLSYQWRWFGWPIPDETNSVLMLTNVQNSGSYDVLVSNAGGSQASAAAGLTVLRPASISPTNFLARYDVTNGFSFKMNVQFGRFYRIQMSTNLTTWSDITNFVGSATVIGFVDPVATNRSPCFYRMVSP